MQDIFAEDVGSGIPLVLVHGFLGSSDMWEPQIEYFKKKYRILTPALPGFGKSNKVKSCNSIEDMDILYQLNYLKQKLKSFIY